MNSSLFWCIMGIVGGAIASLIISFWFYLKSRVRKHLTYEIKTFCIISNKIQQIKGLEIKYNSSDIEYLYCSTIIIKNIGNSIIKKSDLVTSCPIAVLTDGQFLNAEPYCIDSLPKNKTTNYNLSPKENNGLCNCIEFNFDYIPQKAIISYSLFHTSDITFHGDLMDGKITTVDNSKKKYSKTLISFIAYISALIASILSVISSLISFFM